MSGFFDDIELVPADTTPRAPDTIKPARVAPKPRAQIEQAPPSSIDCEQGIIACALMDGSVAMEQLTWLNPDHFYDLRLGSSWRVLAEMHKESKGIDLVTFTSRLKALGMLEACGGMAYFLEISQNVPSTANLPVYAESVRDCAIKRQVLQVCQKSAQAILSDHSLSATGVVGTLERGLDSVLSMQESAPPETMQSILSTAIDRYQDIKSGRVTPGFHHGFRSIRRYMPLRRQGELILIAGRPSSGKTSLAVTMDLNSAAELPEGQKIAIMSLETRVQGIVDRCIGNLGGIEPRKVDMFSERDDKALLLATARLSKLPIIIEHGPWDLSALISRMTELATKHGVVGFTIDYVELIESGQSNRPYREQIAVIAKALKHFKDRYNVNVVLLCQMSRESEKENRRPRMSDLGESGALEKIADVVWMIWKPKSELFDVPIVTMKTYFEKCRDGCTGEVEMVFEKPFFRYTDVPLDIPAEAGEMP